MLDLSYLSRRRGQAGEGAAPPAAVPVLTSTAADLDAAYARYTAGVRARDPDAAPMSAADFERYSLGAGWLTGLREAAKRVVQTCRLVVGIHDYGYYLEHMRSLHPEVTPLSRDAFYRYCLEARYPSAGRSGSRCPC